MLWVLILFRIVPAKTKWMKAQNAIAATARQTMNEIITRSLKEQGKRSREDWLNQLDRIHGTTRGCAPRKKSSAGVLTPAA